MFICNLYYIVISSNYVKYISKWKNNDLLQGNNTPMSDQDRISPYNTD